jgi:predicted RNA polymerase sigma factor
VLDRATQHQLRELTPQVLGALVRRYGNFAACEDAVQEALIAAAAQWPDKGAPDNPRGWLIRVAARKLIDDVRSDVARKNREHLVVSAVSPEDQMALSAADAIPDHDDTLDLLFMCCHPSLTPPSAIALTLRAVGGLTTPEIAAAFLVPEATMGQRISRAKQTIADSGVAIERPSDDDRRTRLAAVMHTLYLIFNEGYTTSSGPALTRLDLAHEAIRLTRMLHRVAPDHAEVDGLLALMLLTDARREARTGSAGELVPLDEQDRTRWDAAQIAEGTALIAAAFPRGAVGPYQIQAAIAACHDEAATVDATDWAEIRSLYGLLLRIEDSPMVRLNHAVATAMVDGPAAGLSEVAPLAKDARLKDHHRLHAVRAHLHERAGDTAAAISGYAKAAELTSSIAERDYLLMRAARLR